MAWDAWVRQFVDGVVGIAATHPGAFHALRERPVQGARATASFEIALAAFAWNALFIFAKVVEANITSILAFPAAVLRFIRSATRDRLSRERSVASGVS